MISPAPQTILIVEDDPTMAHIADNRCTAHGYRTHCVSSGEQALQWIENHCPDLMLMDIALLGMDGLQCVEQLRQHSACVETNILIISSCEEGDTIERAFSLGVDDFIQKPVNWQILIRRIQRILHSKQTQAEVNLLYNAAANGHNAIMISDSNNRLCYVNPAFSNITGYSRDEVIGKDPKMLASGRHPKSFYQAMWQQINGCGEWKGTLTDRRKDGTLFEHRTHISAIHINNDPTLPISHYLAVSTDATQQIAYDNLKKEQKHMQSIITTVGGVAHDFNNMLAGITGNTFLMQNHINHPDKLKKYIDTINQLGDQGASLIKKMLAFVQRDIVQKEPLALNESVNEAIARQKIPIQYRPLTTMLEISADHHHIAQILDALLDNARDAISHKTDGKITIQLQAITANHHENPSLKPDHAYAKLSVADNGDGMDAETETRIFEPFFTTKPVNQGTGLGLSMVYGSMATHHGCVQVDSCKDKGSCFTLYFPLLEANHSQPTQRPTTRDDQPRKLRLLLVDDEEAIREVSQKILLSAGFEVIAVSGGDEALQQLLQLENGIDLALLDVVMPDINGIDLARQMRQQGHLFPIIFCTGYNCYEVLDQAANIHNIDVINKPFCYDKLIEMVKNQAGLP